MVRTLLAAFLFSLHFHCYSFSVEDPQVINELKQRIVDSSDSLRVHLFSDLCYEYRFVSQDSALKYGNAAADLARELNYKNGLAQAFNDLGIIYSDRMEIQTAGQLYNKALIIWSTLGDSARQAAMYNKLGILYQSIGKLDSAAYFQFQSLAIFDALGIQKSKAQALNNIGNIFSNKGEYNQALKYHNEALETRRLLNDNAGIGSSLVNIGNIHFQKKEMVQATSIYKEAIPYLEGLNAKNLLSGLYNNLGASLLELNDLDSCKKYLSKAITIRTEIGDTKGLTSSYQNLAKYELLTGNYQDARNHLGYALNLAEQHKIYPNISEIHLLFVTLESTAGAYRSANGHALKYAQYRDSVFNQTSNQLIQELQAKYETEKKEQQIALQKVQLSEQQAQNQRNAILIWSLAFAVLLLAIIVLLVRSRARKKQDLLLKEGEIRLQESLLSSSISSQENERKRFARDLHDGFGQMISVLNLNLHSLEKGASDKESIFENSSRVLDDMYKELKSICFNLMPETLIKNGVVDALREFAGRINLSDKVYVKVDAFGIDGRLPDLVEINLYRISQEWINNVIKYSDATTIHLQITKDETEITLLIEDNGSGFEKTLLTNGKGNGWKNMQSRTNLLKGELELDTTAGQKGNTLILNVPVEVTRQPVVRV